MCNDTTKIESNLRKVAAKLKKWDGNDIRILKDLVNEFFALDKELVGCDTKHLYDFSSLPHRELIPEDLRGHTDYPIWAVDRRGYCLVGDNMQSIDHANTIRQAYGLPEVGENPYNETL